MRTNDDEVAYHGDTGDQVYDEGMDDDSEDDVIYGDNGWSLVMRKNLHNHSMMASALTCSTQLA